MGVKERNRKSNKFLRRRISLENAFTEIAIASGEPLKKLPDGRISSMSPTAYRYATSNAPWYDKEIYGYRKVGGAIRSKFNECNKHLHGGRRGEIEEEIYSILKLSSVRFFFELKNFLLRITHSEWNIIMQKHHNRQLSRGSGSYEIIMSRKYNFYSEIYTMHRYSVAYVSIEIWNRVQRLAREWGEISKTQHHKVKGSQRRRAEKLNKNTK